MKTRFLIAFLFIAIAIAFCAKAATIVVKISEFPNTTAPANSDLFILASGSTNKNISWNQLKDAIGTNPATVTILNNLYVSNVYATNISVTNLTVLNQFNGKTTITTNLYVDYITNNYAYITNLFVTAITTNFYLFSTNVYNADTYVSNYFTTNVFNDTYVSNFFVTNQIFYQTNQYLTYISTTNFIDYITNNYISNFWNTNIYVNDTYVSNYFVTNYNPLIEITSNYTYNVAWPLTNATLYGTTTFSPVSGTVPGRISLQSSGVETISLAASNGMMTANLVLFKTNAWAGPTNNWPMLNGEEQYYVTYTPVSMTNMSMLPPTGYGWNGLAVISNASTTNITWVLPSGMIIPERTNVVVVSNASRGMLSGKWSPATGTNAVYRQF